VAAGGTVRSVRTDGVSFRFWPAPQKDGQKARVQNSMLVFSRSVRPLYSARFARLMSAGASEMKCLKLEVKDGVALVRMNDPDSKVNALSVQVIADFEKAIKRIETDDSIKAAVLISGAAHVYFKVVNSFMQCGILLCVGIGFYFDR
jgi:hypothetical protein